MTSWRDRIGAGWRSLFPPPGATGLLLALLVVDVVFMFLHLVWIYTGILDDVRFSLAKDRGYSEWWQYAKTVGACILLGVLALRLRALVLAAWALALAYIVLDDALLVHERVGLRTKEWFGDFEVYGFTPDDLADLVFTGVVGAMIVGLLAVAHWKARGNPRRISTGMFVLVVLFAVASIGMDAVGALYESTRFNPLGTLLEDGGELIVMSVTVWLLWLWLREFENKPGARGT